MSDSVGTSNESVDFRPRLCFFAPIDATAARRY